MNQAVAKARQVRLMGFDIDGVMTDGRLYFGPSGDELKAFFTRVGRVASSSCFAMLSALAYAEIRNGKFQIR